MPAPAAHFPSPVPIDAYGNGGFRFADMSHKGSLLILPSGIYGWEIGSASKLLPKNFEAVFAEAKEIEFLLLGTGPTQRFPEPKLREAFVKEGVGLEVMDTGAACRTFNVLLAEARAVAAALIAVD
jgi:uncharacterized protein